MVRLGNLSAYGFTSETVAVSFDKQKFGQYNTVNSAVMIWKLFHRYNNNNNKRENK